jgi:hypothetical protein
MATQNFYDIHFHAMNLAHPNILAFAKRINWRLLLLASPLAPAAALFGFQKFKNVQNLLSVMENDAGAFFMLVEYYLREQGPVKNGAINIGDESFTSIVITPLLMDFGFKNIPTETFYRIPPRKPIVSQVEDVFSGIADYCAHELREVIADGKTEYKVVDRTSNRLFEIYPFLGLNTQNYTLAEIEKMLEKYFSDYRARYEDFKAKLGKFEGYIDGMRSNFFAGIKLYPPIGFNPWPAETKERAKVECLYGFCCAKEIPLTVHCSDGGFKLHKKAADFTCPDRWISVLSDQRFGSLKLNLAHFGKQSTKKYFLFSQEGWRSRILELISYPNVFTDFSYIGVDEEHYGMLKEVYEANPALNDKLLFGSDFMINLLDVASYNTYLDLFCTTTSFGVAQKKSLCNTNPEKFLWRQAT